MHEELALFLLILDLPILVTMFLLEKQESTINEASAAVFPFVSDA